MEGIMKIDPNFAAAISGTYVMKTYVTKASGASTPGSNDKILISRINDKHVELVIDYADPKSPDVTCDDVSITKNGSKYELSQNFSNATMKGSVEGNDLSMEIDYTNGSNVKITATK